MKYCILQPGQIGDVIICLPIAKKLYDEGHEIIWPLWYDVYPNFNKNHIDYVKFLPVPKTEEWYNTSIQYCNENEIIPLDLSFNQIGSWGNENTKKFKSQNEIPFDVFKYILAGIDIEEKWNLKINRNYEREESLFKSVVKNKKYSLIHLQGSDFRANIEIKNPNNLDIIEITPITDCIFDWLGVIENAEYLIMLDSAFANLIDQLKIKNKKFFIKRRCFTNTPLLKGDWKSL